MKVFLDANILFSASDEKSATRTLLDIVAKKGKLVTSPHAREEARRNLDAKRPRGLRGLDGLDALVTVTHAFARCRNVDLPEKDKPILAGAVGAKCTHLWTSDRTHFGPLYGSVIAGVKIVSSVMLADELRD